MKFHANQKIKHRQKVYRCLCL